MAEPTGRARSHSDAPPRYESPTPGRKSSKNLTDRLRDLVVSSKPNSPRGSTIEHGASRQIVVEAPPQPVTERERFAAYIRVHYPFITVLVRDEVLWFVVDNYQDHPGLLQNFRSDSEIVAGFSRYRIGLEMPVEVLFGTTHSILYHLLSAMADHISCLKCYPLQPALNRQSNTWVFPKLEHLDLSRCPISNDEFQRLSCPVLKEVILSKTSSFTADEIIALPTQQKTLQAINWRKCSQSTTEHISQAFALKTTNLLFFLKSAQKYNQQPLLDVCLKKLKELFGESTQHELVNNRLILSIDGSKVVFDCLKSVISKGNDVHVRFMLDQSQMPCENVQHCISWLLAIGCSGSITLELTDGDYLFTLPKNEEIKSVIFRFGKHVTDRHFAALFQKLPKLERVICNGCLFESTALLPLQNRELIELSLANTPLADSDLVMLCKSFKNLSNLVLDNTLITRKGILELKNLGKLETLSLAACQKLDEEAFMAIARSCPHLRRVSFHSCKTITEKMLTFFFDTCPMLQSIDVRNCDRIPPILQTVLLRPTDDKASLKVDWNQARSEETELILSRFVARASKFAIINSDTLLEAQIMALFSKFSQQTGATLASLKVLGFTLQDAKLIEPIKNYTPHLKKLKLRGLLGFPAPFQIAQLKNLRQLSLKNDEWALRQAEQNSMNDDSLMILGKHIQLLQYLRLEGFSEITETGINSLLSSCKALREIYLKDCPKITKDSIGKFATRGFSAQIVVEEPSRPYQIAVRDATKADFQKAKESMERELDNYGTIIFDSPTSSPAALAHFKWQIASYERKICDITDQIAQQALSILESRSRLLSVMGEVGTSLSVIPDTDNELKGQSDTLRSLYTAALVTSQLTELCLSTRAEKTELIETLADLNAQYDQGIQIAKDVKTRIAQVIKEQSVLETKTLVLTISSQDYKSLKPYVTVLEQCATPDDPLVVKIIEKIKMRECWDKKFELVFLLTPDELAKLVALKITG